MNLFKIEATSAKARTASMSLAGRSVATPAFMPVGTQASVKALWPHEIGEVGSQIVLANAYHLYLRPGHRRVERLGGLRAMTGLDLPFLTDSGGFQVFSLSRLCRISREGAQFRSHIDGSLHLMSPELCMDIQRSLGSDIAMCFDECPALPSKPERLRQSVELTLEWAGRCKGVPLKTGQRLFGIVQGGLDEKLRGECLERLVEMGFCGYALGGLSVGEKNDEMRSLLERFVGRMPEDSPRYLMGVGTPTDILHGVGCGLDLFDCVLPTRNARHGRFFTSKGPLDIRRGRFAEDRLPPDPDCGCRLCRRFSRAYVHHLFRCGEPLAAQMITFHNLSFYLTMMGELRNAIKKDSFDEYRKAFYKDYTSNEWR